MTDQQSLPFEPARVHARRTDPYTSDKALKAVAKDGTLMQLIWTSAKLHRMSGKPFNDTLLTEWIERATCKRQQRNVVARSRGMLEDAGVFRQVGVRDYGGQQLMHYEIDTASMVWAELDRQIDRRLAELKEQQ